MFRILQLVAHGREPIKVCVPAITTPDIYCPASYTDKILYKLIDNHKSIVGLVTCVSVITSGTNSKKSQNINTDFRGLGLILHFETCIAPHHSSFSA